MTRVSLAMTITLLALFSGCATVPMASPEKDQTAKQFIAPTRDGRVYCYRPYMYVGAFLAVKLVIDGKRVIPLATNTYTYFDLPPGKHTLGVISAGHPIFPLKLDIHSGDQIFVWIGWNGGTVRLTEKEESVGRKGVSRCGLVQ